MAQVVMPNNVHQTANTATYRHDSNQLILSMDHIHKPLSRTDNSIEGVLQLYNVPLNRYQPKMNAHGGCFAHLNINGRDATLFCFTKKDGMSTKLFVVEVGNPENPLRAQAEINFQQANDFIVGGSTLRWNVLFACLPVDPIQYKKRLIC
eukprot:125242_1